MGAFTDWLISSYGIESYLSFTRKKIQFQLLMIYGMTIEEMDIAFMGYVSLFEINNTIRRDIRFIKQYQKIIIKI